MTQIKGNQKEGKLKKEIKLMKYEVATRWYGWKATVNTDWGNKGEISILT
jgi:hypothetical protein